MVDHPSYSAEEGLKYNEAEYKDHPDFGKLTFAAPYGVNVVEVIGRRQTHQRHYIDIDNPHFFYIERSTKAINMEVDGIMRAIDFSLHQQTASFYESGLQKNVTSVNLQDKNSGMRIADGLLTFNNFQLKRLNNDNSIEILESNWSTVNVNNFGYYVVDIFPFIDLEVKYAEGRVKSNLIIKQNLNAKEITFIDNLGLPVGYNAILSNNNPFNMNFVEIYDTESGVTEVVVDPARTFDASGNAESWLSEYEILGNNLLIKCDSIHLNDPSRVYPITVDPTFTAVGPVANGGGVMGSLPSPASCTNNIVVNFPGGSTPWDTQITWTVLSDFCAWIFVDFGVFVDCLMSEAQVRVTSSCGGASPGAATVWTCPGCNTIGYWTPTIGFNQAGTQSLAQCYSASCANQNLTFTISLNRLTCASNYGYDNCVWANSYCQSLDDWSITVQGRSVETLGNTATGNGTQNIYDADCAGSQTLNPTPLYGVGPYSYSWSHGPTSPTVSVPGTVSTYTVDVTDACGTTVTATFDIGCPLNVDIKDFSGLKNRSGIDLNLDLQNEEGINMMRLLKSKDGENWEAITHFTPEGGLNYKYQDNSPFEGTNYYKYGFDHEDDVQSMSDIVAIDFNYEYTLYPNPSKDLVTIDLEQKSEIPSSIKVVDLMGRSVLNGSTFLSSTTLDVSHLENGNYSVLIYRNGELIESKRLTILR